jgi:hypothetical protein
MLPNLIERKAAESEQNMGKVWKATIFNKRICLVIGQPDRPLRKPLMNLLSRDAQISPDKNINFPCINAAFALPPEPAGFVVSCQFV